MAVGPFEYSELTVVFMKPVWNDLSFETWCDILLKAAIRKSYYQDVDGKQRAWGGLQCLTVMLSLW